MSAPKDGTSVLLFDAHAAIQVSVGRWEDRFYYEWSDKTDCMAYRGAWTNDTVASFAYEERAEINPTHWMPLPERPA